MCDTQEGCIHIKGCKFKQVHFSRICVWKKMCFVFLTDSLCFLPWYFSCIRHEYKSIFLLINYFCHITNCVLGKRFWVKRILLVPSREIYMHKSGRITTNSFAEINDTMFAFFFTFSFTFKRHWLEKWCLFQACLLVFP